MIHYITTEGISNPWVGAELGIVQRRGIPFVLHSMRPAPESWFTSNWARRIQEATRVLYPLPLLQVALSTIAAPFLFKGRFFSCLGNALLGERESLRARVSAIAHLFVACHWARGLRREPVALIHAQWAHSCATIGMYGAWLLGVPFSFTGHAVDLFRDRVALRDKIRRAEFIVCISEFHRDFYRKVGARDDQLQIVYCGVDVSQLAPAPTNTEGRRRFRILSLGRLVNKKGFDDLIEACQFLAADGLDFECVIAGDGPLKEVLDGQVARSNLTARVRVTGEAVLQESLNEFMNSGDVFCLPCVKARDGDMDGLPRTLMEAMACGVPTISTRLVGIPDLVVDGRTGLLVAPGKPKELARAIRRIDDDPELARRLGGAGRQWVIERFNIDTCLEPLLDRFRKKLDLAVGPEMPSRGATEVPVGSEVRS